jgi:hypothetical protein
VKSLQLELIMRGLVLLLLLHLIAALLLLLLLLLLKYEVETCYTCAPKRRRCSCTAQLRQHDIANCLRRMTAV